MIFNSDHTHVTRSGWVAHHGLSTLQHIQFLMDFFHILIYITDHWHERVCCAQTLWPLPVPLGSFSQDFVVKLLYYYTCRRVHSTARIVMDGFFSHLAQMIANTRECAAHNDIWLWTISSRSFIQNFAIKLLKYGMLCSLYNTYNCGWILSMFGANDR